MPQLLWQQRIERSPLAHLNPPRPILRQVAMWDASTISRSVYPSMCVHPGAFRLRVRPLCQPEESTQVLEVHIYIYI